jgi:hypothetical protein
VALVERRSGLEHWDAHSLSCSSRSTFARSPLGMFVMV